MGYSSYAEFMEETQRRVQFLKEIETIFYFLDEALEPVPDLEHVGIKNYKLEDIGDAFSFSRKGISEDVHIADISKIDENSLRVIYDAIALRYIGKIELGSTMDYKDGKVDWHLAPVINDRFLLEMYSSNPNDQTWFYQELVESTKQKGLL